MKQIMKINQVKHFFDARKMGSTADLLGKKDFSIGGRGSCVRESESSCRNLCHVPIIFYVAKSRQTKSPTIDKSVVTQLGGITSSVLEDFLYATDKVARRLMASRSGHTHVADPYSRIRNVLEVGAIFQGTL